ncbi:MAG: hypothetical protein ABJA66_18390 [Actinomycetota bacterium]
MKNFSVQQRLNKQISVIDSLKTKTPEERALADRKALAISSNLKPEQLTGGKSDKLGRAAEREARRRDEYDLNAQKTREDQARYLKIISEYDNRWVEKAQNSRYG